MSIVQFKLMVMCIGLLERKINVCVLFFLFFFHLFDSAFLVCLCNHIFSGHFSSLVLFVIYTNLLDIYWFLEILGVD